MNLESTITNIIKTMTEEANTVTKFRQPLVGFSAADDPLFTEMKNIIGPYHLHPQEMLPEAKTVISFFLPFSEDIVKANKASEGIAREWAVAYIEANKLIGEICKRIKDELTELGIGVATEKATHNFNEETLEANWSHKSAAYVAGLGTFGLHKMLITPTGCAGRFGSVITAADITPTPRPKEDFCLHYKSKSCLKCVKNCPTGALSADGLDKKKCYKQLLKVDKNFSDLELCDVCGKCAIGPCARYDF